MTSFAVRNARFVLVLLALTAACGSTRVLTVGPSSPRPTLAADASIRAARLEIAATVPDRFTAPAAGRVPKLEVSGWHQTITSGFEHGLESGDADAVLRIHRAELSFTDQRRIEGKAAYAMLPGKGVIFAHGVHTPARVTAPKTKIFARIEFKAELVPADGAPKQASGVVFSGTPVSSEVSATTASRAAVETMLESIAAQLSRYRQGRTATASISFQPPTAEVSRVISRETTSCSVQPKRMSRM